MLNRIKRGQIAFEFLVVYSFILIVFVSVFLLIVSQRAVTLNAQQYSTLQLLAQNVASNIDMAVSAGNGYNATAPLLTSIGTLPYNITISSTGVVIASVKIGSQIITAQAYSSARDLVVNGTGAVGSTNAIRLTRIRSIGVLKVTNLKGVIFVDSSPAQITQLAQHMSVSRISRVQSAAFNGSSCATGSTGFLNNDPNFTISSWVYLNSYANNALIYSEGGSPAESAALFINSSGAPCMMAYNRRASPHSITFCAPLLSVPLRSWTYLAATLKGGAAGSGTFSIYENNLTNGGLGQNESAVSTSAFGIGCNIGYKLGQTFNGIDGSIADLQIYNATLQQSQIGSLYKQGIGASPSIANALLAWYPFAGNADDYSGHGNHAAPANIIYENVAQITVRTTNANGTAPTNGTIGQTAALTGFVASAGSLGFHGSSFENETACGNVQSAFLTTNTPQPINITITGFNGNSTYLAGCEFRPGLKSELVGWWPLDEGYGNAAHDLSGSYNDLFSTGTLNGYPGWSIANRNLTEFQAGAFTAAAGENITVPQNSAYNAIVNNGTVSVVAWIYEKGALILGHTNNIPPTYQIEWQGIFGDLQNSIPTGFEIGVDGSQCSLAFVVGSGFAKIPGTSCTGGVNIGIPLDRWIMVSGTYNRENGMAELYVNDTLVGSSHIGSQPVSSGIPFEIGGDSATINPDVFNGSISDVQLYGSVLSQSQIENLYIQGVTGAPLSPSLLGWWALDGNPNDYSSTANNGIAMPGTKFANAGFDKYSVSNPAYSASFNPSSANALQSAGSLPLLSGNRVTVTAWIKPMRKQANAIYNGVFRYGPGGTCPSAGANTIQIGIQGNGIPELATWCNDFAPADGPVVSYNSWNFIAGILNGTNADLFLNGIWINGTLPRLPDVLPGPIVIGSTDTFGTAIDRVFNGSVSDVQIYNTTLTPQQILQLYEQGLPMTQRINLSG